MATPSGTTNLGAVQADATRWSTDAFLDKLPWWGQFTSPITGTGANQTTYREGVFVLDGSDLTAQADNITPRDIVADDVQITASVREALFTLTNKEVRDNPAIIADIGRKLGRIANDTLGDAMLNILFAADTTAHPLDGSTELIEAQGGGQLFIADAYQLNHPDGTTTNQSNVGTTALSRDQVRTEIQDHWGLLGWNGRTLRDYDAMPILVAPADLMATSDEIRMTNTVIDASGLQIPVNHRLSGVVEIPGAAADANDWWMIWSHRIQDESGNEINVGPIRPWIRHAPEVVVTPSPDSNHLNFKIEFEYGIFVSPDVHFRMMMSSVA